MSDPENIEQIAKEYGIVLIYLFGSKAKKVDSKVSDIDIEFLILKNL